MKNLYKIYDIADTDVALVGSKARSLARLMHAGYAVPDGVCVSTEAYRRFVKAHGLAERVEMELVRKDYDDMRWEEMWDASLRVRNMFANSDVDDDLVREVQKEVGPMLLKGPVVVRSSAPGEDEAGSSFAGVHKSYVNLSNVDEVITHIKLVWASLFSDGAIMYREELGLDTVKSAMAVVIQQYVVGDVSGVAFAVDPSENTRGVVEAVCGTNQAMVDGEIEPYRWFLSRESGEVVSSHTPEYVAGATDVDCGLANGAEEFVESLYRDVIGISEVMGAPQDVEWTRVDGKKCFLQSRPISTIEEDYPDKRQWHLSLRRSFENLRKLRVRIEDEYLPDMQRESDELGRMDFTRMDDTGLAGEIERRSKIVDKWNEVYWAEFIPFAHGVRLFGEVYNDVIGPEDPFEFVQLLSGKEMEGKKRNEALARLAAKIKDDEEAIGRLEKGEMPQGGFAEMYEEFVREYGDLFCASADCESGRRGILVMALEIARNGSNGLLMGKNIGELEDRFVGAFDEDRKEWARDMLDLARTSYRLRDDDNIYMAKIKARYAQALEEGRSRLLRANIEDVQSILDSALPEALRGGQVKRRRVANNGSNDHNARTHTVQVMGQPSGPGIAGGYARVIDGHSDLFEIKRGEVLICDAIDPAMTFAVALASAIVERRGGMLIHGAIVAREYGIPCVTGVKDATGIIRTGEYVIVDGYLGIVRVVREGLTNKEI